ncbi:MAG: ABC transporter permease [Tannerellaceae bacterium]|nr:ABC transporter permease [Tannerellaceae bacterium]
MKILNQAIRSLSRNKLYSYINMIGLTLSLSCFIILSSYVYQETTVDHFCEHPDDVYLLTIQRSNGQTHIGTTEHVEFTADQRNPLDDPAIKYQSTFIILEDDFVSYNEYDYNATVLAADSLFLKIVTFPVVTGSSRLDQPNQALLTEEFARKLFGKENPVGKSIRYSSGKYVTVTGVIGKTSTKSSFTFDVMISKNLHTGWMYMPYNVVLLEPGTDYKTLNKKNEDFLALESHFGIPVRYQFFPLKKFYFDNSITLYNTVIQKGNSSSIWVLSIASVLILILGLFNFINLYTVIVVKRSREFGVKKVYGAGGTKIFTQLLTENILLTGVSLLLSWCTVEIFYWILNDYFQINIQTSFRFNVLLTISLLVSLSLIACLYPYLKFTYSTTVTSIRNTTFSNYSLAFRMIILSIQYIFTLSLIVSACYFMVQLNYMLHTDVGYNTKNIIQSSLIRFNKTYDNAGDSYEDTQNQMTGMANRIKESTLFFHVTGNVASPNSLPSGAIFSKEGFDPQAFHFEYVSQTYFDLFEIELKEGRLWDPEKDKFTQYRMIINETAQQLFNIQNLEKDFLQPESRMWWVYDGEGMDTNPPYEIVGVVKDFKIGHLSGKTPPVAFFFSPNDIGENVIASVVPGKKQEAIRFLQEIHKEYVMGGEFTYLFLEDEIAAMYETDKQTTYIYVLFAIIAILISCLGLFGISLFDIRQRYHEIAIRKVNGALSAEIMQMLLKKYVRLFLLSSIVSIPVSYLAINYYTKDFAHKTPLSGWIYILAFILTASVSFLTLYYQVKRAADMNPAETIKSE